MRNISLSLSEWTEIREELGIKRERNKYTKRLEDQYWAFKLHSEELKDFKKTSKEYPSYKHCFSRSGAYCAKDLKSQHLINRLYQQEWRSQDLNHYGTFEPFPQWGLPGEYQINEEQREDNFNQFIGFIFNCDLKNELDIRTSREKLIQIWEAMSKEIKNSDKHCWFHRDLDRLADKVIMSIC